MEYNKKNIRDADKQGIFDSSFDSRVLEMDGEEKKELSRKLQESTSSVPEDDIALSSSEEEPEKDALSRLSVWERILFFLQKIFMGATEKSYLKKIELKKVAAIVRHYRPSCYAINSGRLSSQFGEQLYKLASQLAGFKRVYDSCREHPGHQGSNLPSFFEYFVKAFSEDMVNLENKFSYSYISKNKGLFSGQKLSETIDKEINSILSTITMDQRRQMNVLFSNLIGFERLAEFNFYLLLRKFGNNFSSLSEGYPQFEEVSGRDVLNELRKLEDLLYSIDFSVDMNTPFEILLRFYSTLLEEEERQDETGKSWKSEDFRVLVDMMQGFLKEDKLVNLVRLIASIPFHKPHVRRHSANVIEMFRQAVQKRQIGRCQSLASSASLLICCRFSISF